MKIKILIIAFALLLFIENYKCGEIIEVTRKNIFEAIKENSPMILLFKNENEESQKMQFALEKAIPYLDSIVPPISFGIFIVTSEHQIPMDFLIYSFPTVKLFTGYDMPKTYVGRADDEELTEWLQVMFEGTVSSSTEISEVDELRKLQIDNEFVVIFLGETQDNPDFSLYLNVIKKIKSQYSSIQFAHSNDDYIKKYLKISQTSTSTIVFYNREEERKYEYPDKLDFFNLIAFIEESKINKFYDFSDYQVDKLENSQKSIMILFIDSEDPKQNKLAAEMAATRSYFLKTTAMTGVADPLHSWDEFTFIYKFNITVEDFPQLLYLNQDNIIQELNPRKYRFDKVYPKEKISKETIIKFYEDVINEKIEQFYNGQYMDEEEKEINEELFGYFVRIIKKIVADNYEEFISNQDKYNMVLYLKDQCIECSKQRKKWLEVIKHFKKATNIQFGIINLSKNDHPKIKIIPPQVMLFHQGESKEMSMSDINTVIELKNWVISNTQLQYEEQTYQLKQKTKIIEKEENKIEL